MTRMFYEDVNELLEEAMRECGKLIGAVMNGEKDETWLPYGLVIHKRNERATYPNMWVFTVYPVWAQDKFEEDLTRDLTKTSFDIRTTVKF